MIQTKEQQKGQDAQESFKIIQKTESFKKQKKSKVVRLAEDLIRQEPDKQQKLSEAMGNTQKTGNLMKIASKDKSKNNKFKEKEIKKLRNSGVGITIGKSQRTKAKPEIQVGPCEYEPRKLDNRSGCKFPQSSVHYLQSYRTNDRVGPGLYHNNKIAEPQKNNYTIGWKYESIFDVKNKNAPGPGQYQSALPNLAISKSKSISVNKGFGTSNRFSVSNQKASPGPCDYENGKKQRESINKKRTISSVGRQLPFKQQPYPGPASYENPSIFESFMKHKKGLTMGIKNNDNRASLPDLTKEAFNKYTIIREFDRQNAPAYTIGQQKRRIVQPGLDTPSPLDYNNSKMAAHSPSARIGQADLHKHPQRVKIPGPGAYQSISPTSSAIYTFTKSKSISVAKNKNQMPGVGKYNISVQQGRIAKKGPSFGREKRAKDQQFTTGVGDYDLKPSLLQKKGITFPKAVSPK